MNRRIIRSDFGEVSIRTEGIINARVFRGATIGLQEAQQYHSLIEYLSENRPHCTVIDISDVSTISPDARKMLQENSSSWNKTIAVALITKSFTSRVLGNFFLTVNRPSYPIQIFRSSVEAQNWAQSEYFKNVTGMAS